MDTLILNAGHSQLEEQLKIAAVACEVNEQSVNVENVKVDDGNGDLSMEDVQEGFSLFKHFLVFSSVVWSLIHLNTLNNFPPVLKLSTILA